MNNESQRNFIILLANRDKCTQCWWVANFFQVSMTKMKVQASFPFLVSVSCILYNVIFRPLRENIVTKWKKFKSPDVAYLIFKYDTRNERILTYAYISIHLASDRSFEFLKNDSSQKKLLFRTKPFDFNVKLPTRARILKFFLNRDWALYRAVCISSLDNQIHCFIAKLTKRQKSNDRGKRPTQCLC